MADFIINFQSPVELADLCDRYISDGMTNIDHILNFENTLGQWTVDKDAQIGDTVFFMCAKTSKDHMGHVCAEARRSEVPKEIMDYVNKERELYKKYSGKIVAIGKVADEPFQTTDSGYSFSYWRSPWYARIGSFKRLTNPIDISEYRDYISVSRTGSITKLGYEQSERLMSTIRKENPEL